jgi:hypothetical protein
VNNEVKKNGSQLNWPTVALILATGGVNLFSTNQNSQQRGYQLDRAIQEIHELHSHINQTLEQQKRRDARVDEITKDVNDVKNMLQNRNNHG